MISIIFCANLYYFNSAFPKKANSALLIGHSDPDPKVWLFWCLLWQENWSNLSLDKKIIPFDANIFFFAFQLEIIDACVSYIEKLQSQLQVKPNFDFEGDDEGIEEGYLDQHQQQQHQQTLRRLTSCNEFEDCNGNLEKWKKSATNWRSTDIRDRDLKLCILKMCLEILLLNLRTYLTFL